MHVDESMREHTHVKRKVLCVLCGLCVLFQLPYFIVVGTIFDFVCTSSGLCVLTDNDFNEIMYLHSSDNALNLL